MREKQGCQNAGPGARLALSTMVVLALVLLVSLHTPVASAASLTPHRAAGGSWADATIQTATAANSAGGYTNINDGFANGNPNALVFVTPDWNPGGNGGVYDNHPIGVWYNWFAGEWSIFNQDGSTITQGAAFNVYTMVNATYCLCFTQVATSANTVGNTTDILSNSPEVADPNAILIVTPNWNPGGNGGVYDDHPIGVWYHSGRWSIFNQDNAPMPQGAAFNVMVQEAPPVQHTTYSLFVQTATTANSFGDSTSLNDPITNGNPSNVVFVTPNWNPGGHCYWRFRRIVCPGVFDNHPIGVWYDGANWLIFNQDGATLPNGAAFNVFAVTPGY